MANTKRHAKNSTALRIELERPEHTWHKYVPLNVKGYRNNAMVAEYAQYCAEADADQYEALTRETSHDLNRISMQLGVEYLADSVRDSLERKIAVARACRQNPVPLIRLAEHIAPKYVCQAGQPEHLVLACTPKGELLEFTSNSVGRRNMDHLAYYVSTMRKSPNLKKPEYVARVCAQHLPGFEYASRVRAAYFYLDDLTCCRDGNAGLLEDINGRDPIGNVITPWDYDLSEAALKRLDAILTGKK